MPQTENKRGQLLIYHQHLYAFITLVLVKVVRENLSTSNGTTHLLNLNTIDLHLLTESQ